MSRRELIVEIRKILITHWHAYADETEVAEKILAKLEELGFPKPEQWVKESEESVDLKWAWWAHDRA